MRRTWIGLLTAVLACAPPAAIEAPPRPDAEAWGVWHAERLADLVADDGWLNLVGLHWLGDVTRGPLRFGPGPNNDVVLEPAPSLAEAPARLGTLHLEPPGRFDLVTEIDAGVTVGGEAVPPGTPHSLLQGASDSGMSPQPAAMERGDLEMTLIARGGNWALRVRDRAIDGAAALGDGIEVWAFDPSWVVDARFEPYPEPVDAEVPNVTPFEYPQKALGEVVFTPPDGGEEVRLLALRSSSDERLFLIVGDATNGRGSYGGGRYLYAGPPANDGSLVIDFNRIYNPPCVFTTWATCPLPPRQNRLAVAVEAGEKYWGGLAEKVLSPDAEGCAPGSS